MPEVPEANVPVPDVPPGEKVKPDVPLGGDVPGAKLEALPIVDGSVGGVVGTTVLVVVTLVSFGLAVKTVQLSVRVPPGLLAVTALLLKVTLCATSWKSAAVGLPAPAVRVRVPVAAL